MKNSTTAPSFGAIFRGAVGWWAVFTVGFIVTLPVWGRPALGVLRFILDGLDSFGSGY